MHRLTVIILKIIKRIKENKIPLILNKMNRMRFKRIMSVKRKSNNENIIINKLNFKIIKMMIK